MPATVSYDPRPSKRYIDMTEAERAAAFDGLLEAGEILGRTIGTLMPSRAAGDRNNREIHFLLRVARSRGDSWPRGV